MEDAASKLLDKKAMISAISAQIRSQILGIFGDEENDACIAKLHSMVELANSLKMDLNIVIKLEELTQAHKNWVETMIEKEEEE